MGSCRSAGICAGQGCGLSITRNILTISHPLMIGLASVKWYKVLGLLNMALIWLCKGTPVAGPARLLDARSGAGMDPASLRATQVEQKSRHNCAPSLEAAAGLRCIIFQPETVTSTTSTASWYTFILRNSLFAASFRRACAAELNELGRPMLMCMQGQVTCEPSDRDE